MQNWKDFLITSEKADTIDKAYIVFEEDAPTAKMHDLVDGIFTELEPALHRAKMLGNDFFVAEYKKYIDGNYDYLNK